MDEFTTAVEKAWPQVCRAVTNLVAGDVGRAEDITQEAVIRLWQQWQTDPPVHVANWLCRVASRIVIDQQRRRKYRLEVVGGAEDLALKLVDPADPCLAVLDMESGEEAAQRLHVLSPAEAETIGLLAKGFSYEEIAILMQVPLGTAKRRACEGRQRLRGERPLAKQEGRPRKERVA